jgi:hypothetical protein
MKASRQVSKGLLAGVWIFTVLFALTLNQAAPVSR